ncbi:U6 snRNA phosphodiesterase 1-like [Lineus longissimus]|uniref:U6 snRNA phosphodiesterase 1-like n=1 Tax=Lineus longissimus TaxID=88925 RepID=UPI002B4DC5DD
MSAASNAPSPGAICILKIPAQMSVCLVGYSSSSSDSEVDVSQDAGMVIRKRSKDTTEHETVSKRSRLLPAIDKGSSTEGKVIKELAGNSKKLPSVPSNITGMFLDKHCGSNVFDDKAQHEGRTRQFKHERGNWATSVYIPVEGGASFECFLQEVIECVQPTLGEMKPVDDFHISVSRTFPIRHHWIDPLTTSLRDCILNIQSFPCNFQHFKFYVNDDESRSFLGLNVSGCEEEMKSLVGVVDSCLKEFRLPMYYEAPSFHMSIGWTLGDIRPSLTEDLMDKLGALLCSYQDASGGLWPFMVEQARCKIGNKCFNFPLRTR